MIECHIESHIPAGLHWLQVEGRVIFSVNGGMTSTLAAVLIEKAPIEGSSFGRAGLHEENGGRWYVIEMSYLDGPQVFFDKAREAIKALTE